MIGLRLQVILSRNKNLQRVVLRALLPVAGKEASEGGEGGVLITYVPEPSSVRRRQAPAGAP
ncbi:MAG: hypothetical protein BGO23_05095 [Solirubrobacterales bacterium 67-14]|nr:MAG: hypothetical protein BGO23_05095 [Solirubrobacterales bacterium 67-14]